MNIKVCGITQFKQLQQLDGLNIAYAGIIFEKNSNKIMELNSLFFPVHMISENHQNNYPIKQFSHSDMLYVPRPDG